MQNSNLFPAGPIYQAPPKDEEVLFQLAHFHLTKLIARGGMGEVYLAFDPICGRYIALKKIREELKQKPALVARFLREARITCHLTHPTITPIYSIYSENDHIFYTMPYIEGETLKAILHKTARLEKSDAPPHPIGSSILHLVQIYASLCRGIAYAHSLGIIHRDLKPDNIMIGRFGEVYIFDWGLSKLLEESDTLTDNQEAVDLGAEQAALTRPGKTFGTLAFLPPERALGKPETFQSDIYTLGIILYQLLTLQLPFQRKDFPSFKKNVLHEKAPLPSKVAPKRDIPRALEKIVEKCLSLRPEDRYQTVEELLQDIEAYLSGRSEWLQAASLEIGKKGDWEFHESVLFTKHLAISRQPDFSEWVGLMVSKSTFSGNVKMGIRVTLRKGSKGIGFLLNIPEARTPSYPKEGYCLWMGSKSCPGIILKRSFVDVQTLKDAYLEEDKPHHISIESIENNIYVYLNGTCILSYLCHLPPSGAHVGVLYKDSYFSVDELILFEGNMNRYLGCLAVPDAFLSSKHYDKAIASYTRIRDMFSNTKEEREALFRTGIAFLEKAKEQLTDENQEQCFHDALGAFEKLGGTRDAPLEYLGKSLVYQALGDTDEEIKCLELAFRKYRNHPMLKVLEEQILYRLHENAQKSRHSTYRFLLTIMRALPHLAHHEGNRSLIVLLERDWEPLPIFSEMHLGNDAHAKNLLLSMQLAFWLGLPYNLEEIGEQIIASASAQQQMLVEGLLLALANLRSWNVLESMMSKIPQSIRPCFAEGLREAKNSTKSAWKHMQKECSSFSFPVFIALCDLAIEREEYALVEQLCEAMEAKEPLDDTQKALLDSKKVYAALFARRIDEAWKVLSSYPMDALAQESSPLYFLYGCYLAATQGEEAGYDHFSNLLKVPYPRSWSLFPHLYSTADKIDHNSKKKKWFLWEKRALYLQASLFYLCSSNHALSKNFQELAKRQKIDAPSL